MIQGSAKPNNQNGESMMNHPMNLPALKIELTGMVTANNLPEFRDAALAVIDSINTDLQTDDDFAAAEEAIKWAKQVEEKLDDAKALALSQTASIDELFRAIDDIREQARAKRLDLDKLVKARKDAIRVAIINAASASWAEHVSKLEQRIAPMRLPSISVNFAEAMKGKKTVQSLNEAATAELLRAKLAASDAAGLIQANIKALDSLAGDYLHLFADLNQICAKPADHFEALVRSRVAEHKESEHKRLEAEHARIRAEEEAKARREAEARLEAERETIRREERRRAQADAEARAVNAPERDEPSPTPAHPVSEHTVRLLIELRMEWDDYEFRREFMAGDLELHSSVVGRSIGAVRVLGEK